MPASERQIEIPASAIEELQAVEEMNWGSGVSLPELLDWINQVVERFRPKSLDSASRTSTHFTVRSFRHYQTLGCIAPPEKIGTQARYFFLHYLQGLVIRKLLWQRIPASQIAELLPREDTAGLKAILLDGIKITPSRRPEDQRHEVGQAASKWTRISLKKGVELHLNSDFVPMGQTDAEEISALVRKWLIDGC